MYRCSILKILGATPLLAASVDLPFSGLNALPEVGRYRAMRKVSPQLRKLLGFLTAKRWFWRAAIAGLCGSLTHTLLMLGKAKLGVLESFQPYQSLQIALSYTTGEDIHPLGPWLLSYINGSTAASFSFANLYRHLPGNSGPIKGFIAGVLGWLAMNLIFFPLLGLGPFVTQLGLGVWPALFSLGMMLAYSVVMGIVYSMIDGDPIERLRQRRPSPS
jgi:hypothetical protein